MTTYSWVKLPSDISENDIKGSRWPLTDWWYLSRHPVGGPRFIGELYKLNFTALTSQIFTQLMQAARVQDQAFHSAPALPNDSPNTRFPNAVAAARNGSIEIPVLPKQALCANVTPEVALQNLESCPWPGLEDEAQVVMGIIDDGIPIAHPAFQRAPGKTRVLSLWQQDATCMYPPDDSAVTFGRHITRKQIDEELAKNSGDAFYENLDIVRCEQGYPNRFRYHGTHGGAVADLFCGASKDCGDDLVDEHPEKFPIFAVNLGTGLVEDTAGSFLGIATLEAVIHIIQETEKLIDKTGKEFPLVINFSFGLPSGGRDGAEILPSILDIAAAYWQSKYEKPFFVVMPSGNTFHERGVQTATITRETAHVATLRVEPGCMASTIVEIEMLADTYADAGYEFDLAVDVIAPFAVDMPLPEVTSPDPVHNKDAWVLQDSKAGNLYRPDTEKFAALTYFHRTKNPLVEAFVNWGRETVTLALQPTQQKDGEAPTLPPGDWKIIVRLRDNAREQAQVDLRVLRNDLLNPVLPRGQKARWVDPHNLRFDDLGHPAETFKDPQADVVRSRTINALSSGKSSIVVGATQGGTGPRISPYSSAGPSETLKYDNFFGVTLVTEIDENLLMRGRRTIATRPGATQRRSGTSLAAPIVGRWIACTLASGTHDADSVLDALKTHTCHIPHVSRLRQGFGEFFPNKP